MPLKLMYITNNLDVALIAQKYGVDRVWIDLETKDKEERQKGINAVKSHHSIEDIKMIKPHLKSSELLVRINHWNNESVNEIESVISAGADMIMLPYWKSVEEVRKFVSTVKGRCSTTLLLETKEAVDCVDDVLSIGGFDEIHIGLNDLHLSYGMTFMFEPLANGTVEMLCNKFRDAGLLYGFGGIAKLGEGLLPSQRVIMEHYRLGSTRVILSRSFCDYSKFDSLLDFEKAFKERLEKLREYELSMQYVSDKEFDSNRISVENCVLEIVKKIKESNK